MTSLEWIQIAGICVAAVASIAALIQSVSNHFNTKRRAGKIGDAIERVRIDINGRLSQYLHEREAKGYLAGSTDAKASGSATQLAEELLATARLKAAELLATARDEAGKRLAEAQAVTAPEQSKPTKETA